MPTGIYVYIFVAIEIALYTDKNYCSSLRILTLIILNASERISSVMVRCAVSSKCLMCLDHEG